MSDRILNTGIFGRPNAGKSSLLNFLTGTQTAIVSDLPGTTADPVSKRMEVPEAGICNFIDTAGLSDGSSLASLKDEKTFSKLGGLDAALLMIPFGSPALPSDLEICSMLRRNGIPFMVLLSKADIYSNSISGDHFTAETGEPSCFYNAVKPNSPQNIDDGYSCLESVLSLELSVDVAQIAECSIKDPQVKERIFAFLVKSRQNSKEYEERPMFEGLVRAGDNVALVCPIDSEAPAGRLILPQVMAIRQLLDLGAVVTVLQPEQLPAFFENCSAYCNAHKSAEYSCNDHEHCDCGDENDFLVEGSHRVSLVVTDSQAFARVAPIVPADVPLTSFSMLLARAKGPFEDYLAGMRFLESLDSRTLRSCRKTIIDEACGITFTKEVCSKTAADSACSKTFQDEVCGITVSDKACGNCVAGEGVFRVLMLESCTHHATCEDIGRVKIPAALTKYIKGHCSCIEDVQFMFVTSDDSIPESVPFDLAVQCGGCVVTKRQLMSRLKILRQRNIPLVNYGMCLALCAGIWKRVGAIFK